VGVRVHQSGPIHGRGTATFEWIEDGAFVLQRVADVPSPEADPDWVAHSPMPVTSIIGLDDTTLDYVMLYADARGVFRIYRMSLDDDSWQLLPMRITDPASPRTVNSTVSYWRAS
jgi:hypothetical protein